MGTFTFSLVQSSQAIHAVNPTGEGRTCFWHAHRAPFMCGVMNKFRVSLSGKSAVILLTVQQVSRHSLAS